CRRCAAGASRGAGWSSYLKATLHNVYYHTYGFEKLSIARTPPSGDLGCENAPSAERGSDIGRLVEIMRRLRDPVSGCEWDTAQDFATIAPYTIEEAYEVAD